MLKYKEKQRLRNELYYARIKLKEVARLANVSESAVSQYFNGGTICSPSVEKAALTLLKQHYETSSIKKTGVAIHSYFFPVLSKFNMVTVRDQ